MRRPSETLVLIDERFGAYGRPCNLLVRSNHTKKLTIKSYLKLNIKNGLPITHS